ncbi:MAG: carboxymuconolactone decarboxylase family protein [Solirubrobacteraceae bacterium]
MSNADLTGLPPGNWNILPVARVAPLARKQVPPFGRLALWIVRRVEKTNGDYNVFGTLAHLGSIFPAQAIFLPQLLKRGRLARAEKEQVILRTAWRLGAVNEYGHHQLRARQFGLTDAATAATTTEDAADQTTRIGAFLAAADDLLATHTLSDEAFTRVLKYASEDELVELCVLVGQYSMVSMLLNTASVQLEPEFVVERNSHRPEAETRRRRAATRSSRISS